MSLPELAVKRPIAVVMLVLAVVMLGFVSVPRLSVDLLPKVSDPRLVLYTALPQTSSVEVERLVTERLEAQVASVPGVEHIASVSRDGVSLITLRFRWGTDMDLAFLNVRDRLDQLREGLPVTASRPQILRVDPASEPIMVLAVAGAALFETKELAENVFRRRLEQLEGVAQAQVSGGVEREILVEVNLEQMEAHGLTMQMVAHRLAAANHASTGATILEGRTRYPLRTVGEFQTVAEISEVVVAEPWTDSGGRRTLRVRDVGQVVDGYAEREVVARYNGRESVGILVFKEPGANTVQVARQVEEVTELLRLEFPEVRLDVASSEAGFISDSIRNVVSALGLGGILAFLVLFLFLGEPRYPVAVALAIPISVIATFLLMWVFDISLNIMSLGGLALGVGMLVDNSIIVLENIFRHREEGVAPSVAAGRGADEVSGAITASTLTTIAVFVPIIYVEGIAGELFRDLSLTVAFSLLTSLGVALTLLPSAAARMGVRAPQKHADRTGPRAFDVALNRTSHHYHRALAWSLDHRGWVLGASGAALAIAGLGALTLKRDLLPRIDHESIEVTLELLEGTALSRTVQVASDIEAVLLDAPEVEAVFGTIGRDVRRFARAREQSGFNTARFLVRTREGFSSTSLLERLQGPLQTAGADGVVTVQGAGASTLGLMPGGREAQIAVRIRGRDQDKALAYADQIMTELRGLARVTNVRMSSERGRAQIEVQILRDEVARFGLQSADVAVSVDHTMRGILATDFMAFDRKVPVVVRPPDLDRFSRETLERIRVKGIPLEQLVSVRTVQTPAEVKREGQGRVVSVLADVRQGGLGRAVKDVDGVLAGIPPPESFWVEVGGENEEMRRSFRDLGLAFALALILVFMVLAAQFESFLYPATILAAVPLALVGAILALWVTGQGLNTMSLIGLVILVGIVVNDSIVKVDFILQARSRGAGVRDAILDAGRVRLRPILMTTVTTVFGLTPMALGLGRGADLRAPLALAIIGGLLLATALTLIVIPVLFSLAEGARAAGSHRPLASRVQPDPQAQGRAVPKASAP
jgi:HAE1 family hydrophobic/amphiphilic exporter-1